MLINKTMLKLLTATTLLFPALAFSAALQCVGVPKAVAVSNGDYNDIDTVSGTTSGKYDYTNKPAQEPTATATILYGIFDAADCQIVNHSGTPPTITGDVYILVSNLGVTLDGSQNPIDDNQIERRNLYATVLRTGAASNTRVLITAGLYDEDTPYETDNNDVVGIPWLVSLWTDE